METLCLAWCFWDTHDFIHFDYSLFYYVTIKCFIFPFFRVWTSINTNNAAGAFPPQASCCTRLTGWGVGPTLTACGAAKPPSGHVNSPPPPHAVAVVVTIALLPRVGLGSFPGGPASFCIPSLSYRPVCVLLSLVSCMSDGNFKVWIIS